MSILNNKCPFGLAAIAFAIIMLLDLGFSQTPEVGKWRRFVVDIYYDGYGANNPFEIEFEGVFTHAQSQTQIVLPGYYDGNDSFKIAFMPTLTGQWTYITASNTPSLDGISGQLNCVESGHPGMLKADPSHPRKWKFIDGPHVVPIALRMEFFSEPGSLSDMQAVATFLDTNHIQMLETRLTEEYGQFGGRHDFIFEGDWQNHKFDLAIWNRMEQRMEILTEWGLGGHIMFYSDDDGEPGWSGKSATELLVIRYTIARLASFPVVWFNTGIDIAEYRSQSDVNWFGQQIRSLDPYGHPVSSRYGGGSGNYVMSDQTFDSRGDRRAYIDDIINYFTIASVPVSMDDAWGENMWDYPDKAFYPEDIRRAFWKCLMAGGTGGLIRSEGGGCGHNYMFHFPCFAEDLESEQWLRLINPFIETKLGNTFAEMVPAPSLVTSTGGKYALADPQRTRILYFLMGVNDRWDNGDGGPITIKLSGLTGSYAGIWLDTRTGNELTVAGSPFTAGFDYTVNPPSTDDWILFLTMTSQSPDSTPPSTPTGFGANPVSETEINLVWNTSIDPESGISHYILYRDGNLIAQPSDTSYSDTGLSENTTYTYQVAAVNGAGLQSGLSVPVTSTTLADTTPPTILSAGIGENLSTVLVTFSEPVEENSATNIGNYNIDNGISISSASLGANFRIVTLNTSPHSLDTTYTLTVNDVFDRASNPNPIAPNTQVSFTASGTDITPPSIPSGVNAVPINENRIDLTWNPANDPESGISHYKIYRDPNLVGEPFDTSFSDTGLEEHTAYVYEVSAVNGVGLESGLSNAVSVTTLADIIPPTILSAGVGESLTEVIVMYSEPMEQNSAENVGNYSIDNSIDIFSASLNANLKIVTLHTSPHSPGITYTLTVNNVFDLANNPNPIAPNTRTSYMVPEQVRLSNIMVVSGREYEVAYGLSEGDLAYIDRNFVYSHIPDSLIGNQIAYIRTANDDKLSQISQFLTFDMNQSASVYVAHDDRYQIKPDWLSGNFDLTSMSIRIGGIQHSLFKKIFPAGQVTLGGNVSPSEPEDNNMYTVIVAPYTDDNQTQTIIERHELFQNFPNPFNETTNIKFNLTESEYMSLKVFNIKGEIVQSILNDTLLDAGENTVTFDGSQLSSGVYFYQLIIRKSDFKKTRKMVLLR